MKLDFLLFLTLGMLDTFAILALMFRCYRFPFFEYYKEVLLMSFVVTLLSYVIRVELDGGVVDLVVQMCLYILFFRAIIKVRMKASIVLSLVYLVYGALSFAIYIIYRSVGLVSSDVTQQSIGYQAYLMQLSTSSCALLIAYIMYRFGWGRSSIIRPPHFLNDKFKPKEIAVFFLILVVATSFFILFHFISHWRSYIALPTVFAAFTALIYLSNRRGVS